MANGVLIIAFKSETACSKGKKRRPHKQGGTKLDGPLTLTQSYQALPPTSTDALMDSPNYSERRAPRQSKLWRQFSCCMISIVGSRRHLKRKRTSPFCLFFCVSFDLFILERR